MSEARAQGSTSTKAQVISNLEMLIDDLWILLDLKDKPITYSIDDYIFSDMSMDKYVKLQSIINNIYLIWQMGFFLGNNLFDHSYRNFYGLTTMEFLSYLKSISSEKTKTLHTKSRSIILNTLSKLDNFGEYEDKFMLIIIVLGLNDKYVYGAYLARIMADTVNLYMTDIDY